MVVGLNLIARTTMAAFGCYFVLFMLPSASPPTRFNPPKPAPPTMVAGSRILAGCCLDSNVSYYVLGFFQTHLKKSHGCGPHILIPSKLVFCFVFQSGIQGE